jgi:hypothetical protein
MIFAGFASFRQQQFEAGALASPTMRFSSRIDPAACYHVFWWVANIGKNNWIDKVVQNPLP